MLSRRDLLKTLFAVPACNLVPKAPWFAMPEEPVNPLAMPRVPCGDVEFLVHPTSGTDLVNVQQIFRSDYFITRSWMATEAFSDKDALAQRQLALDRLWEDVAHAIRHGTKRVVTPNDSPSSRFTGGYDYWTGLFASRGITMPPKGEWVLRVLRPLEHRETTPPELDAFQGSFIIELGLGVDPGFASV